MRDSEMWLIIKDKNDMLRVVRLGDVVSVHSNEASLVIYFDEGHIRCFTNNGQGIIYKGTFLQCLSYVDNKENYK